MGTDADELKQEIEQTRDGLGQTLDAIGDKVNPSRMMERRKRRIADRTRQWKDRVMGSAHHAADTVTDTADGAVGTVKGLPEKAMERTEGSPMAAGAIAFGVGALAAAVIPTTRAERERSSQVLRAVEPLKEEVTSAGKELADHLRQPAQDAAHAVSAQVADGAREVVGQRVGQV